MGVISTLKVPLHRGSVWYCDLFHLTWYGRGSNVGVTQWALAPGGTSPNGASVSVHNHSKPSGLLQLPSFARLLCPPASIWFSREVQKEYKAERGQPCMGCAFSELPAESMLGCRRHALGPSMCRSIKTLFYWSPPKCTRLQHDKLLYLQMALCRSTAVS